MRADRRPLELDEGWIGASGDEPGHLGRCVVIAVLRPVRVVSRLRVDPGARW